ncbi:hypothetical protein BBK14_16545 [Parafrankia soli]|uniref:Histidine kinase/HSP90-like ATPase domain-containing protein n=1 Tax=Parafrankia soli TaxID=2599596 RepID=A0A1S1QD49_9ACTN|nr:hypothetical protein BBK14_16545 [Parafrankia soli]
MVTNAVRHARSDLVQRASVEDARLRISVEDRDGSTLPRHGSSPGEEAESGWGLLLVEALSQGWGVETTPGGKRVWFDLELSPRGPGMDSGPDPESDSHGRRGSPGSG